MVNSSASSPPSGMIGSAETNRHEQRVAVRTAAAERDRLESVCQLHVPACEGHCSAQELRIERDVHRIPLATLQRKRRGVFAHVDELQRRFCLLRTGTE